MSFRSEQYRRYDFQDRVQADQILRGLMRSGPIPSGPIFWVHDTDQVTSAVIASDHLSGSMYTVHPQPYASDGTFLIRGTRHYAGSPNLIHQALEATSPRPDACVEIDIFTVAEGVTRRGRGSALARATERQIKEDISKQGSRGRIVVFGYIEDSNEAGKAFAMKLGFSPRVSVGGKGHIYTRMLQ